VPSNRGATKTHVEEIMAATNIVNPLVLAGAVSDERSVRFDRPFFTTVLVKLLNSAHEALRIDRVRADKFIATAATLIRAEIERENAIDHGLAAGPVQFHLAPWQARRVLDYIEANLDRTIRIEELAGIVRRSISHFSRAFRADFGVSPYTYITRRRITRAQELMLSTDKSLASIAVSCGLADQSHLSRMFRRLVGVTPALWRRLRCSALQ
jgi:AraC-like DNA-binding protein